MAYTTQKTLTALTSDMVTVVRAGKEPLYAEQALTQREAFERETVRIEPITNLPCAANEDDDVNLTWLVYEDEEWWP